MTREEFNKLPIEEWQHYVATAIGALVVAFLSFWALNWLFAMLRTQYADPGVAAYLIVPLIAVVLAGGAYFLREVVEARAYPMLEIGIGMAAAAQAVHPTAGDVARFLALIAGVRIIVDGLVRFVKFSKAKAAK